MKLVNPIAVLIAVVRTAWSGVRPGPGDSRKWYDRMIRAAGGLILVAVLIVGLILAVSSKN